MSCLDIAGEDREQVSCFLGNVVEEERGERDLTDRFAFHSV
jgi:hypothetical protein